MEITKDLNNKIVKILSNYSDLSNPELEVRFSRNNSINSILFDRIIKKLLFNKQNNGYGLTYKLNTSFDIIYNDNRISINGLDSIKMIYIQTYDNIDFECLSKKNISKLDINEYNIRISLADEVKQNNITIDDLVKIINNKESKYVRYKKRYSIISYDNNFRYDFTIVKSLNTKNILDKQIFNSNNEYEIEIEYIGNNLENDYIYKSLIININIILQLYLNSNIIMDINEINNIETEYKKLIKDTKLNFIAKNPITLEKKNLNINYSTNIFNNYAVSYKADGERNFLYISSKNGELYLINSNFIIRKIGLICDKLRGTLIEGEYIGEDKVFLAYDILFFNNKDIRKLFYNSKDNDSRYKSLIISIDTINKDYKIIEKYNKINIEDFVLIKLKTVEFSNEKNIFINISKLLNKSNISYNTDGIILTPILEEYPSGSGSSWLTLFKWKPQELNSIDFLVKFDDKINFDKINNKQYKSLKLYVNNKNKAAEFKPNKYFVKDIHIANILIEDNNKIFAYDKTTNRKEEIQNNSIVEFIYNINEHLYYWVPIRIRHDKTELYNKGIINRTMNATITAYNIWENMNNPITEKMITSGNIEHISNSHHKNNNVNIEENKDGESKIITDKSNYYSEFTSKHRYEYRLYNNFVKKQLIFKSVENKPKNRLLDLSSGQGGDMMKWIDSNNINEVIGIDISKNDIETAKSRYKNYKGGNNVSIEYIWGDSSKLMFPNYELGLSSTSKNMLKKYIPSKFSFDVISLQFSLHYFFKDSDLFLNLLNNISSNLKIGGYFIGTCFDGNKINTLLKDNNEHVEYLNDKILFKIEKQYNNDNLIFNKSKGNFGLPIDVFIESIGKSITEYLVNFDFFENILTKKMGFKKIYIKNFKDFYKLYGKKLSAEEKNLSYLNNAFIFEKVSDVDIDNIKLINIK